MLLSCYLVAWPCCYRRELCLSHIYGWLWFAFSADDQTFEMILYLLVAVRGCWVFVITDHKRTLSSSHFATNISLLHFIFRNNPPTLPVLWTCFPLEPVRPGELKRSQPSCNHTSEKRGLEWSNKTQLDADETDSSHFSVITLFSFSHHATLSIMPVMVLSSALCPFPVSPFSLLRSFYVFFPVFSFLQCNVLSFTCWDWQPPTEFLRLTHHSFVMALMSSRSFCVVSLWLLLKSCVLECPLSYELWSMSLWGTHATFLIDTQVVVTVRRLNFKFKMSP